MMSFLLFPYFDYCVPDRQAIQEPLPLLAVVFFGGLNKKYQCQTVSLRPPLHTGILECSQAHIGYPIISAYKLYKPHL